MPFLPPPWVWRRSSVAQSPSFLYGPTAFSPKAGAAQGYMGARILPGDQPLPRAEDAPGPLAAFFRGMLDAAGGRVSAAAMKTAVPATTYAAKTALAPREYLYDAMHGTFSAVAPTVSAGAAAALDQARRGGAVVASAVTAPARAVRDAAQSVRTAAGAALERIEGSALRFGALGVAGLAVVVVGGIVAAIVIGRALRE